MAWEYVTCNDCGDEYQVQMFGKRKEREWKINTWKGICQDCKDKKIYENVEKNKNHETPLIGTDKQISWAYEIREIFINNFNQKIQDEDIKDVIYERLFSNNKSWYWIDNKDYSIEYLYNMEKERFLKENEIKINQSEFILKPEYLESETIANVIKKDDIIYIKFPEKNENFRKLMRNNGFGFVDGFWKRQIKKLNGTIKDRFIEICYLILKNNFIISIDNDFYIDDIEKGNFEKEQLYWIKANNDYFFINMFYNDGMYEKAKRLSGSKYNKPDVIVPISNYEEVIDFANINDYKFSEKAKEKLNEYKNKIENALLIKPNKIIIESENIETESYDVNLSLLDEN